METIRVGIAGFGLSAQVFHAPFLAADPRYEIRKFYLRQGDASRGEYPQAQIVRSYEELRTPDIDLVVLCVPNALHYEMARAALLAGKHVVVEKPLTRTAEEAQMLFDTAQECGRLLAVYQNRRLDGGFRTVQQVIESGELGEILDYKAHFDRYLWGNRRKGWRGSGAPGVNLLYDLGAHLIDQACVLFGMPKEVYADFRHQQEETKAPFDQFTVTLYYDTLHATLTAGELVAMPGPRFTIHGRNGSFRKYGMDVQDTALESGKRPIGDPHWGEDTEDKYGTLCLAGEQGLTCRRIPTVPGHYGLFYDRLYRAITEGAPLLVQPAEAVGLLRIIEAALRSGEEKRRIAL